MLSQLGADSMQASKQAKQQTILSASIATGVMEVGGGQGGGGTGGHRAY